MLPRELSLVVKDDVYSPRMAGSAGPRAEQRVLFDASPSTRLMARGSITASARKILFVMRFMISHFNHLRSRLTN